MSSQINQSLSPVVGDRHTIAVLSFYNYENHRRLPVMIALLCFVFQLKRNYEV